MMLILRWHFVVFVFALKSGASSTGNKSMPRDFFLTEKHLQRSTFASISRSAPQNGRDVVTEKHTFSALIFPQKHSRSYRDFRASKNRVRGRSRSVLSTSLRNFRQTPIPEQTQQVSTGKPERKAGAMDKLAIDHDLNEHTASYLGKLFRPHAAEALPLHYHRSPLFPEPGSRRRYGTQRALAATLSKGKQNLLFLNPHSVRKSTSKQQIVNGVLDQTRHLGLAPATSSRAKSTLKQVENHSLHPDASEATRSRSNGHEAYRTRRPKRSILHRALANAIESVDHHHAEAGTLDHTNSTQTPSSIPEDDAASLQLSPAFSAILHEGKNEDDTSVRAGGGHNVSIGKRSNLDIAPAGSKFRDTNASSPRRTYVLDSVVGSERPFRYLLHEQEKKTLELNRSTLRWNSKRRRRRNFGLGIKPLLQLGMVPELKCLALFLAGHKYFGFDSRRGNEISWRYREKGFYKAFPRPRLKKLHSTVVDACADGLVECVRRLSTIARSSYILKDTECAKNAKKKVPADASVYFPFDSAIDMFRFRTTATYYMCWHALKRRSGLEHMKMNTCLGNLAALREPLGNQKRILDYRGDNAEFQCALISFCPDPCYGRKTTGIVPDANFLNNRDPGNPCRALKTQSCTWDFKRNHNFDDLQRNRFNITCQCHKERAGFAWDSKYHLCVDVDECANSAVRQKCGKDKRCQNTVGGYECLCRPGYLRDQDTNKCQEQMDLNLPSVNHSLANMRRLRKMLQPEASASESRRDREEGGELDSHEEASPEEIKSREVVLG